MLFILIHVFVSPQGDVCQMEKITLGCRRTRHLWPKLKQTRSEMQALRNFLCCTESVNEGQRLLQRVEQLNFTASAYGINW